MYRAIPSRKLTDALLVLDRNLWLFQVPKELKDFDVSRYTRRAHNGARAEGAAGRARLHGADQQV